jgi:hypothetical protein
MAASTPPAYWTEQQVADLLAVKPQTLRAWRVNRRVPLPFAKIGAAIRYRPADVEQFIAANTVKPIDIKSKGNKT